MGEIATQYYMRTLFNSSMQNPFPTDSYCPTTAEIRDRSWMVDGEKARLGVLCRDLNACPQESEVSTLIIPWEGYSYVVGRDSYYFADLNGIIDNFKVTQMKYNGSPLPISVTIAQGEEKGVLFVYIGLTDEGKRFCFKKLVTAPSTGLFEVKGVFNHQDVEFRFTLT